MAKSDRDKRIQRQKQRELEAQAIRKLYITGITGMIFICLVLSGALLFLFMLHNFGYDLHIAVAVGLISGGGLVAYYTELMRKRVNLIVASRKTKN